MSSVARDRWAGSRSGRAFFIEERAQPSAHLRPLAERGAGEARSALVCLPGALR